MPTNSDHKMSSFHANLGLFRPTVPNWELAKPNVRCLNFSIVLIQLVGLVGLTPGFVYLKLHLRMFKILRY